MIIFSILLLNLRNFEFSLVLVSTCRTPGRHFGKIRPIFAVRDLAYLLNLRDIDFYVIAQVGRFN